MGGCRPETRLAMMVPVVDAPVMPWWPCPKANNKWG